MSAVDVLGRLGNVHKRYGDKVVLDGLTLEARRGELLALLGPNGAGKTTAINILLGLKRADSGDVTLFDGSPRDVASRRRIGVMLQKQEHPAELTLLELLRIVTSYYPNPYTPEEAMAITRTEELGNRRYGPLSGGLRRQVQFALAICGRPQLIFMDEPTAGLDVEAREVMWKTIRELTDRGTSFILTTHYLEEAEKLAQRVVMLADGKVVKSGSVNEMRALVPRKSISCFTSTDPEQIRAWPNIVEVEVTKEGQTNLVVLDAENTVRQLLAADPQLSDLEVSRAGLAEAFRAIVKGAQS